MAWLGKAIGKLGSMRDKLGGPAKKLGGGGSSAPPAQPQVQQTPGFGASVGVNGTTNPRGIGKWGQGA